MNQSTYPQTAYHSFHRSAFPIQPMRVLNRRRRRWPSRILFFALGLLAGWVLRGGGAWLP